MRPKPWVQYFIQRPVLSLCFVILLIASLIYIIPHTESGFLPEMDEGSIVLDYTSPRELLWKKPTGCYRKWRKLLSPSRNSKVIQEGQVCKWDSLSLNPITVITSFN